MSCNFIACNGKRFVTAAFLSVGILSVGKKSRWHKAYVSGTISQFIN